MEKKIKMQYVKFSNLRGIQSKSGFPIKFGSQIHFPVVLSQVAPTPHTTPSHLSLHLPLIQTCGSEHGRVAEH